MSRVLVTAALGNVGREVVRAASSAGLLVRAADRDAGRLASRLPGVEGVRLDFEDPSSFGAALEGVEGVFLLRPPALSDMERTLNPFIDAAYAAGARHVVFLSVAGAERMSWVPHRQVELHLERSGKSWTVLRPGFFAQNLQDAYLRDIVEDDRLHVPAGEGRVAFIDVRDVAEVAVASLKEPERLRGQALTLTGPEVLTFTQVAQVLSQQLGRPIRYEPASVPGYLVHLMRRRGAALRGALVLTYLHHGLRSGGASEVTQTVAEVLGRPARSLVTYVAEHRELWRRSGT
jgi:uncharacterized protein YbjT (DUF2867 family)